VSLADLVAAGAPGLPEGRFYRVRAGFVWDVTEIRERRRIGSWLIADASIREDLHAEVMHAVVAACHKAFIEAQEYDRRHSVRAFYGDHDPRRTK
jgi:hypothetical protein